jgi:hypothetical protein
MDVVDIEADEFVIVTHNVTAMRLTGARASEQVSQQICGQVCQKLNTATGWTKVESADGYCGWIVDEHLCTWPHNGTPWSPRYVGDLVSVVTAPLAPFYHNEHLETATLLPMGCFVRKFATEESRSGTFCAVEAPLAMRLPGEPARGFMRSGDLADISSNGAPWHYDPAHICRTACELQGVPYVWGGTTPFGYDCSGFVQAVFALHGVSLPRDAYQQAVCGAGIQLPPGTEPAIADLVFFRGSRNPHRREVSHVGIAMGDGFVVHASGINGVAISALASPEIAEEYELTGFLRIENGP